MWATTACGRDVVRPRLRHRLVRQRPVGGVMGVRATRAGGAQAGRRADGGSPPTSAVSIGVHDLLQEVCDEARELYETQVTSTVLPTLPGN